MPIAEDETTRHLLGHVLPELASEAPARYAVLFGQQPIWLGGSLLFGALDLRSEIFYGAGPGGVYRLRLSTP